MNFEIGEILSPDRQTLLRTWKVTVPPGPRPLARHSHLAFEITIVHAGSGVYTVGDKKYSMSEGDTFVFSSNEQHFITEVGDDGLVMKNLHFEPRFLWGSSPDRLSDDNANICFYHNESFVNKIPSEKSAPIVELLDKIQDEMARRDEEYALSVKSYLNLILIKLIRDFNYAGKDSSLNRGKLHSIRRVLTHIDTHLSDPITLEELSEIAGMSPNYFSAMFHDVSGIRLWDYITSKRIDTAIRLLMEDESLTVLDIAVRCGFNSTASFNKSFKKITGMTPTEYRTSGCPML